MMQVNRKKLLLPLVGGVLLIGMFVWVFLHQSSNEVSIEESSEPQIELYYGLPKEEFTTTENEIGDGETMGVILDRFGVTAARIDEIDRSSRPVFDLRSIRPDHKFIAFESKDSIPTLAYFAYEINDIDFLVLDLRGDTTQAYITQKEIRSERRRGGSTITSSLWNSMIDAGMSPAMAMELSDIYAWTIDFFALKEGDRFSVIYDERWVDSTRVGVGQIWGAEFEHAGKTYYAVPFMQDGKITFWDEQGKSLRKNFLKAPLQYSRISSRFSNSRLHPVLRIRRPHHGVDYAAPSGTPVVAIGDGVVTYRAYSGGGGNMIKIKHNMGSLVSGYLHLKGFAKGITVGSRVQQGQLIGYVGSTGLSTGPHLDFRIWQGGTPIDPLKVPTTPAEPVHDSNRVAFAQVRDRILAELQGEIEDSLVVRTLIVDSLHLASNYETTVDLSDEASQEKK